MISLQFLITALVVVIAPGTGVIYTLALGLGQGITGVEFSGPGHGVPRFNNGRYVIDLQLLTTLKATIAAAGVRLEVLRDK